MIVIFYYFPRITNEAESFFRIYNNQYYYFHTIFIYAVAVLLETKAETEIKVNTISCYVVNNNIPHDAFQLQ